jgi:anionic cell wall polymer biosynthesis LytR-Cps2A-Psr (LCP) family protein
MPPRAPTSRTTSSPSRTRPRPKLGGRRLLAIASAAAAALAAASVLDLVWPRGGQTPSARERNLNDLATPPNRPVTLLLIGLDSDRLGDASNQAAPAGPANADALLLLRFNPGGPLQLLQVPAQVAVQLPGEAAPQALSSLYRSGGAALVADAVRELADLPSGQPDRYLVLSRGGLRALVQRLGVVEASPSRTMRHTDKSQKLSIDLQSGLQRLNPTQVEHLVRWQDPQRPVESRLANQQEVARSLQRELKLSQPQLDLVGLVSELQGDVQTNLNRSEALSLLVVALQPGTQLRFTSLPLEPPRSGKGAAATSPLRERVRSLPDAFWAAAEPSASQP